MALSFGGDKPKYPQTPGYGDYVDRAASAMPAASQVVPTSRNPFWGKTIPTYGPPAPYYNLWQGVSEEDRMKPYVISPGDITGQYSLAQPQVTMQRPVVSDPGIIGQYTLAQPQVTMQRPVVSDPGIIGQYTLAQPQVTMQRPVVSDPGIIGQYTPAQPQVTMHRPVVSDPDMPRTYANPLGIKPGGTPGWITRFLQVLGDNGVGGYVASGSGVKERKDFENPEWITRFLQVLGDNGVGGYVASGSGVKERKDFENPEWNPFTSIVEQAMNPNSAALGKQPVSQEWLKQMTDKEEKTKKNQLTSYKPKWDSNVPGFRDFGDGRGGYDGIYTDVYGNKYLFGDSIHGKGWRLIEKGKLPSLTGANKWYYSYPQYYYSYPRYSSSGGGGGGWGYSYPRYSESGGGGNDWVKRLLTSWRIGLR